MSDKAAYPLAWPLARPRTAHRPVNRSFKASFAGARDECLRQVRLLGGRGCVVSTNVPLKRDGFPSSVKWGETTADPGVAVYFLRDGRELCFACDRWLHVQDNMHAICLTIEALRGIARWGTGDMMEAAFRGYAALPERSEASEWWRPLGVAMNASEEQVREAYRLLVKKHHPDAGGDAELFARVRAAWEEFQRQKGIQ